MKSARKNFELVVSDGSQNSLSWILKEENFPVNHRKYYENVASQSFYALQEVLLEKHSKSNPVKFTRMFQIFDQVIGRELISY